MLHYFIRSNGIQPVSFFDDNFGSLERVVRFSGYPHNLLQKIILDICAAAEDRDTPVQLVHHNLDNTLQGVILPELSAGVVGLDVYDSETRSILAAFGSRPLKALGDNLRAAAETFARARVFHRQQEEIYIANMNFSAADQVAEDTVQRLLGGCEEAAGGSEIHRFFGAATPVGSIDYIPQITAEISRRYFVKGRSGTGKSTLLRRVAAAAVARGCLVEYYHCALDPDSLDMIAVPKLDFCLLDSTPPHEYFPTREGDEIIDLYALCVTPGTDEKYGQPLQQLRESYKTLIKEGCGYLGRAKREADAFDQGLPKISPVDLEDITRQTIKQLF